MKKYLVIGIVIGLVLIAGCIAILVPHPQESLTIKSEDSTWELAVPSGFKTANSKTDYRITNGSDVLVIEFVEIERFADEVERSEEIGSGCWVDENGEYGRVQPYEGGRTYLYIHSANKELVETVVDSIERVE